MTNKDISRWIKQVSLLREKIDLAMKECVHEYKYHHTDCYMIVNDVDVYQCSKCDKYEHRDCKDKNNDK